jgi:hypothetical protein
MNKTILALGLLLACVVVGYAQQETRIINLESGTRVTGELQSTIDVRRAKVGDEVVLKTTRAIKSEGRTVVGKGAKLFGRITDVAQRTKDNNASRIGILFDRLEHGSLAMPISASISSITSARTNARTSNEDVFGAGGSSSARSNTSASSSGSGGLVGGVGGVVNSTTNTVGNVVGGTTSAVGSTVNSTTNALGSTATSAGSSLGRIQISESSSTSVQGGSTLSLQGGNLRLEKGANFNLVLTQSASAGAGREQ